MNLNHCYLGDCRDILRELAAGGLRAQMCVTSPPYYGLRDYGVAGQIGLEASLHKWVETMVEVFMLVRDVLADDGTLWLNLGDSYAQTGGSGWQGKNGQRADRRFTAARNTVGMREANRRPPAGIKPKDLIGQPWRVAFALQEAGWYLRQEIIWHKPSPMPESVKDRFTKAHEQLFLLSKSERYYFDQEATKEPASQNTHARRAFSPDNPISGWDTGPGGHRTIEHNQGERKLGTKLAGASSDVRASASARMGRGAGWRRKLAETGSGTKQNESFDAAMRDMPEKRNRRSVWTVPSEPFSEAHFATYPRKLIEPCILAGSRPGDIVLDPFLGSGTTAQVAEALGRQWVGCEIQPDYLPLIESRLAQRHLELT